MRIGLDVGSTTLKCVVLDDADRIIYRAYRRHFSRIAEMSAQMLRDVMAETGLTAARLCVSGSAGMGLAQELSLDFSQEVYATRAAVRRLAPDTDTVIELGGEDAKILFVSGMPEVRMNGSCAGGTGAFIDQMATLLGVTPDELNALAEKHERIHSIASRCGVFAKSDLQALLNQGATREDVAASIFYAVVNQTVAGLAQGREIAGNVLYLGGPLSFLPFLRGAFDEVLGARGVCPPDSLYYVAYGAAITPDAGECVLEELSRRMERFAPAGGYLRCAPLFASQADYDSFKRRHDADAVPTDAPLPENGNIWIGIDAGSTTVKCAAVNSESGIVFSRYVPSSGNPVPLVRKFLLDIYDSFPQAVIRGAASTGYGEEIVRQAFSLDLGVVETVAHYTAARAFQPEVDFIIDIGGQDIKCFRIRGGAIDNIFLNEACSSGCGSFLQSFAGALGYTPQEFAALGLFAPAPVDLGSRCTVFMNSSVKQAQKDGASVECISAGLSISVVKNALYKVIRVSKAAELGRHIVVQGGTFLNDAVLRAFEQETGQLVVRPSVAGLMGAYGAALYARQAFDGERSAVLSREALESFRHEARSTQCGGCTNRCRLTVNTFSGGRRYISGNMCERPVSGKRASDELNLFAWKREKLASYAGAPGKRGRIGMPMALNLYDMLPFWHAFFTELGFELVTSPVSDRELYFRGQHTIPSDTVCYPAKLVHGHIEALLESDVDAIFYPCMSYNFDEGLGDNHYNCPVVAYYPEVVAANVKALAGKKFIYDYIGVHRRKDFPGKMRKVFAKYFPELPLKDFRRASDAAYAAREAYLAAVRAKGAEILAEAKKRGMPVIVLAGRPYHLDNEVCHGIDRLIGECGAAVICEDAFSAGVEKFPTKVLNQWTYHSRMYAAAKRIADSGDRDVNLVQLVSFGCGVDAITADEVRSILERAGRIYTQIKIDEITNPGAVRIRLRSLFAALEQQKREEAAHGKA